MSECAVGGLVTCWLSRQQLPILLSLSHHIRPYDRPVRRNYFFPVRA